MSYVHNLVIAIVGPTATGKSNLAVDLALKHQGEIISADSRQIYRGLDIGTAKPPCHHLVAVRHHLIDLVDPDEPYSLALYLLHARRAISDVLQRQNLPILVGGSGQYIWGLLEGWQVPEVPPSPEIRERLETRAKREGGEALYRELVGIDPVSAKRLDPRNLRRVVRALELHYAFGDIPSPNRKEIPPFKPTIIGLHLERQDLYQTIDTRVDTMIAEGWVDEVRGLIDEGYSLDLPSMSSLGYQELGNYLNGIIELPEAIRSIKNKTHRFARQQYAWFKKDDNRISWFNASALEETRDFVTQIVG